MVVRVGAKVNKIERAGHHVHKSTHVNAPIMFDMATGTYRTIGPVVGKAFHDGHALK